MPFSKRLFDFITASTALVVLSPVILLIAILVRFFLGSPILFRQQRPGYKGHPFFIYKFRTMTDRRSPEGTLLPDSERITSFGHFLRSFSLDEWPEFYNILRGEMSWVGPRPLLMQYLPLYTPEQARRHDVVPGLTGWAQVNGRNTLSWPERFKLDVWYVDNWSFWLDVKIILMTIGKAFKPTGISQEGQATVEYFTGNDKEPLS